MELDLCRAPNCKLKRITASHCSFHNHQLSPLYSRYKNLQSKLVSAIPISIPELLKLYGTCSRIYLLRQEYQRRGFREEFWDSGHNHMIDSLWTKMQKIAKIIEDTIKTESLNSEESKEVIKEDEINITFEENIEISENEDIDRTRLLKLHHKLEQEELWNRRIPCLIKRREKCAKNLEMLHKIYNNLVRSLCSTTKINTLEIASCFSPEYLEVNICNIGLLETIRNIQALGDSQTNEYSVIVAEAFLYLSINAVFDFRGHKVSRVSNALIDK